MYETYIKDLMNEIDKKRCRFTSNSTENCTHAWQRRTRRRLDLPEYWNPFRDCCRRVCVRHFWVIAFSVPCRALAQFKLRVDHVRAATPAIVNVYSCGTNRTPSRERSRNPPP